MDNRSGLTLIKESQIRKLHFIIAVQFVVIIAICVGINSGVRSYANLTQQLAEANNTIDTVSQMNIELNRQIAAHHAKVAAVASFIRDGYAVSAKVAKRIAEAEIIGSEASGIRLSLGLAISAQESRFQFDAISYNGTSHGIKQINLSQWSDTLGLNRSNITQIERNVYGGYDIMARMKKRAGSIPGALARYYGATDPALNVAYTSQVLAKEQMVRRKLVGVV